MAGEGRWLTDLHVGAPAELPVRRPVLTPGPDRRVVRALGRPGTSVRSMNDQTIAHHSRPVLVGATASDPAHSVTIWNHIRAWFNAHGMPLEYALFSTYDVLCRALLDGTVDIAWNAPMAHAQSLLVSGGQCRTLAMRDTDDGVASVTIALRSSGITTDDDLRGRTVAVGVPTSSELRLIPGIQLEREGFIFEPWLGHLLRKRGLSANDVVVVWRTEPFCHCALTARPGFDDGLAAQFVDLLTSMDPADPKVAEMMRLEHLTRWLPASDDGWTALTDAIRARHLEGVTFN